MTRRKFIAGLKGILKQKKIAQSVLAEYMGVTTQTVSTWCRGEKRPDAETVAKIAEYLEVTPESLYEEEDIMMPNLKVEITQEDAFIDDPNTPKRELMLILQDRLTYFGKPVTREQKIKIAQAIINILDES